MRYSSLINFQFYYAVTAPLRHVRAVNSLGLLRALRTHAGFSDPRGHSLSALLSGRSRLGYPQLAIRTGKFGLSALLSFLFHRFSYRLYEFVITDKSTTITYLFFIPWVSGTFPRLHVTDAENLHSANPAYTLYPITVAVQLYPIAFG